jgi:hypothetical protein
MAVIPDSIRDPCWHPKTIGMAHTAPAIASPPCVRQQTDAPLLPTYPAG